MTGNTQDWNFGPIVQTVQRVVSSTWRMSPSSKESDLSVNLTMYVTLGGFYPSHRHIFSVISTSALKTLANPGRPYYCVLKHCKRPFPHSKTNFGSLIYHPALLENLLQNSALSSICVCCVLLGMLRIPVELRSGARHCQHLGLRIYRIFDMVVQGRKT